MKEPTPEVEEAVSLLCFMSECGVLIDTGIVLLLALRQPLTPSDETQQGAPRRHLHLQLWDERTVGPCKYPGSLRLLCGKVVFRRRHKQHNYRAALKRGGCTAC